MITEQYKEQIRGILSCYDRIILKGTLPGWSFAQGMTSFLTAQKIRIFDFPGWLTTIEKKSVKMPSA